MLKRWLPAKRARLKPSTAESYERVIRLHINPNIGHIPVQKLRPEDLDTLYTRLLTEGKRNGSGRSLSGVSLRARSAGACWWGVSTTSTGVRVGRVG